MTHDEPERILSAQRVAYARAKCPDSPPCAACHRAALVMYPTSRIVVDATGDEWQLRDGQFYFRRAGGPWLTYASFFTPAFAREMAKLVDEAGL